MRLFNRAKDNRPSPSRDEPRVVDVFHFEQSSSFKGYKRYSLSIYQEPGVDNAISMFRTGDASRPYKIVRGTPIDMVFVDGGGYKAVRVLVDGCCVGSIYDTNPQYAVLLNRPFDKAFVLIEETSGRGDYFDGVHVYLFARHA